MEDVKAEIQAILDSFSEEESVIALAAFRSLASSSMVSRSPFTSLLGIKVSDYGEGKSTAHVKLCPHHLNIVGITHGAVSYALADVGTGAAASSLLDLQAGEFCVTQDLHYRYMGTIRGDLLVAHSRVVKKGRQTIFVEAQLFDGDRLVGTADGTYVILKK